jgi:hypothetical protein
VRSFSEESKRWLRNYNGSIDATAILLAFDAGQNQALADAANSFDARLPDGTGNGRAYNSYTVARMLRERVVGGTSQDARP